MPKSNSATRALGAATQAVRDHGGLDVPDHLRGSNYAGAAQQGFGTDYDYPHDHPGGWVAQQYLPDELVGSTFYEPSDHGRERVLVEQWRERTQAEDER